jgi:hypothetical protein
LNKISFGIENVELVDSRQNSNFSILSLDFFASGDNLHNLYVSEETLMRTAETIKNCPIIWKYDPKLDDAYGHSPDQTPCGFVPETSKIESRKLQDGRTMLSVIAYVWKRYTGELLNFFKRDGGKKPVSVEMSVFEYGPLDNDRQEIKDFKYEGITVLGSFVTPAIPMASATVLSFSEIEKEYNEDLSKEFGLSSIDFTIPDIVKQNATKGLELSKQSGNAGTSVELASAKYFIKQKSITPEKVRHIVNYFSAEKFKKPTKTDEDVSLLLLGGAEAWQWADAIVTKLDRLEDASVKFGAGNATNPNQTERMEINMKDEKIIEMGDVKEPETKVEEVEAKKEEMAFPPKDEKEKPSEEKPATEEKKKFEFPKNFNMEKMAKFFAEEDEEKDEDIEMAKAECMAEFANPAVLMGGMFAKMCRMASCIEKMSAENKVYMEENESLKKFKASMETAQKEFEVKKTLEELCAKVEIPAEAKEEMAAEAEKFALSDLEAWKTYCKAKSFDFSVKESAKSDVVRVGLPFTGTTPKKNDLWS